jgi:hypothetical protein
MIARHDPRPRLARRSMIGDLSVTEIAKPFDISQA